MIKETVCLMIALLLIASVPAAVTMSPTHVLCTATKSQENGGWLHTRAQACTNNNSWLHYDDGSCETSLGWAKRVDFPLYEIIKFTPTELAGLHGVFDKITICHGYPGLPPGQCQPENYTAWMFTGVDHPLTPTSNTTLVASGFCDVIDDWFTFNLTTP